MILRKDLRALARDENTLGSFDETAPSIGHVTGSLFNRVPALAGGLIGQTRGRNRNCVAPTAEQARVGDEQIVGNAKLEKGVCKRGREMGGIEDLDPPWTQLSEVVDQRRHVPYAQKREFDRIR